MKDRILEAAIQAIATLFVLWFIFVVNEKNAKKILEKVNIVDEEVQISILLTTAVFVATILIVFLEWLIFKWLFKPVVISMGFRNSKGDSAIKQLSITLKDENDMEVKKNYIVHIEVAGGNKLTNMFLSFLKSDIVIKYNPNEYDTEISKGYLSKKLEHGSRVYRDQKESIRIYWSDMVEGAGGISEPLSLSPEFTISPKTFYSNICQAELRVGTHSQRNWIIRLIFKISSVFLLKVERKVLILNLKKVKN